MTVQIQSGDRFETELGEEIRITNERRGEVCVYYPERESFDGGAKTEWRPRESVAAQVEYEDMDKLNEPRESDDNQGEFTGQIRCPICSRFMKTGYDGEGLPSARCTRDGCHGMKDDQELIRDGDWIGN